MKTKIKDLTIQQMVETCHAHQNECCLNCPLYKVCGYTPYELNIKEDLNKEIELWKHIYKNLKNNKKDN